MDELALVLLALLVGLLLGALFFGGLWWTVIKGLSSPAPALWFLGSLLVRMSVTVAGFYLAGGHRWTQWLACLSGFIVARSVVKALARSKTGPGQLQTLGISHAP